MSCTCTPSARDWQSDSSCTSCGNRISEGQLQDAIRLALGRIPGLVLWRNNCGVLPMEDGKRIRFGVGNPGGADLIGCYHGRFLAIEIKTATGKQTADQRLFQQCVERNGGIYLMPRSVHHAVTMIEALRTGFMADGAN